MTPSSQVLRFGIAGGIGFLTTFALTFALTEYAGWWYGAGFALAALIGNAVIFVCNYVFTFRGTQGAVLARASAFSVTYFSSFVINALVVIFCTEVVGLHYLASVVAGTAVAAVINFTVSKHFIFSAQIHALVMSTIQRLRRHASVLILAGIAALIVFIPTLMNWGSPSYQGIELMMLDAENHYFARVHQVYEGDILIRNTFISQENVPFATPPLGEAIIALFGKVFGLDAARAAVVSKPFSVGAIVLLIYALAYALSKRRIPALLAAAIPVLGYQFITFSPEPFFMLLRGMPESPFILMSRLVNPSLSALLFFGSLLLLYNLFEGRMSMWRTLLLGALVGASLYMSPFVFSFLGVLLFLVCVWFFYTREYALARHALYGGVFALCLVIPFCFNYVALHDFPGYEHFARFIGLVEKREFVLGLLLPAVVLAVALFWPRDFPRQARTFLLLSCVALVVVLNQQLITGTALQVGHYHWYVTKPLAGIVAGLFAGYLLQRFLSPFFVRCVLLAIVAVLVYSSAGFVSPRYADVEALAAQQQRYGPLVQYLGTLPQKEVVWADMEASDIIPVYTSHDVLNSVNVGAYPLPQSFFDNRLFFLYRLRGVEPQAFEPTIRAEADFVSGWLWGMWLAESVGDPTAIPDEEYTRLTDGYRSFYARSFREVLSDLGITILVTEDGLPPSVLRVLELTREVGTFDIYRTDVVR